jgi:hypothetical protein
LQDRAESAPLVLGLACRHSQLGGNLQALASLLRVSRAVQHAVLDACSGPGNSQLQLSLAGGAPVFTSRDAPEAALQAAKAGIKALQRINHQARWMVKHGRLVKQLTLSGGPGLKGADEAVMCMAAQPPVQLQALTLAVTRPLQYPAAVLRQLDASHLTSLSAPVMGQDGRAAMPAAIAQLHSLRSLALSAPTGSQSQQLPVKRYARALSDLTRLTELSLRTANLTQLLQHLPSSVVKLQLVGGSDSSATMQLLAGMQQLQQLELKGVKCSQEELLALNGLSSLSHLSLGYSFNSRQAAPESSSSEEDSSSEEADSSSDDDDDSSEDDESSSGDEEQSSADEEAEQMAALEAANAAWEAETARAVQETWFYQHAGAWDASPMLQRLSLSFDAIAPRHMGALWCATSITSLQLQLKAQTNSFDVAAMLAPLRQLKQLCVFDEAGHVEAAVTSLGNLVSISSFIWCGWRLSPLARTQLVTAAHLRLLFIDCEDVRNDEIEAMGHYMTKLAVLGLEVGVAERANVSLEGLVKALSGGRFPALQRLVVDCDGVARTEQEVEKRVAAVRPQLAVETANFTAEGLHKYM